jgi:uncharacterized membrane protein HdeD (DUF308 family)
MNTMLKSAEQQVTGLRWTLGLNGALAIAFGVVVLVWPGISLYALVILFGAYSVVRGVFGLAAAATSPIKQGRGWLVVGSIASIVLGVVVFFYTDMSALALLYVIGAYAIGLGFISIGGAFWLPLDGGDRALLVVTGLVSILFGIVMFAKPGAGALALLALIAAFALVVGITEVVVAIGGKRLVESSARRYLGSASPRTAP